MIEVLFHKRNKYIDALKLYLNYGENVMIFWQCVSI